MNSSADYDSIHRERLQQAKRVMQGLSERQRVDNFDINVYAFQSEHGIVACIAGHCGLDPWFRERGLVTWVSQSTQGIGGISVQPGDFFGTDAPFYGSKYNTGKPVTFDDALGALDIAIANLSRDLIEVDTCPDA